MGRRIIPAMKESELKQQDVLALLLIHGEMPNAWIAQVAGVSVKLVKKLRMKKEN
jgi:hypothetical protein